jgi:peptidoglycan/xylan/chitin deacetylase (PgdA/CDA1 family)
VATPTPIVWRLWQDVGYVPILMYHYVRAIDATADPLGFRLSVRPDRFAEQMDWLAEHRYQPMTVSALAACLRGEARCPARPMAITFDDGYANTVTEALPILQRHGFPATFYIITGMVGNPGYATWDQLRELRDSGMEIGAHTVSHPALTALPLDLARAEIIESKAELESRLDITITSFSYPSGNYNEAVAALVRAAGFTSAVTTAQDDRPLRLDELPRRRVIGGEALAGYEWYFVPASKQK